MIKDIKGFYRHIKTGNMYIADDVLMNATNGINNGRLMVLYHDVSTGKQFVRNKDEFLEKFREEFTT